MTHPTIERESGRLTRHYAEVRARLVNVTPPVPRAERPRPESPFVREVRASRAEAERVAKERLEERLRNPPRSPHWFQIVCEVASKHGLKPREIMRRDRRQVIVKARNECFWRIRNECSILGDPISLPLIGRKFGGMDHTTVLHGYRKHEAAIENERMKNRLQAPVADSPTIHTSSHPPEQIGG